MREGRATFRDLLGRIDAHLRANQQCERLPELDVFWLAVEHPSATVACEAFQALLGLAQGQGFDMELLPFVEASRLWTLKVAGRYSTSSRASSPSLGSTNGPGPGRGPGSSMRDAEQSRGDGHGTLQSLSAAQFDVAEVVGDCDGPGEFDLVGAHRQPDRRTGAKRVPPHRHVGVAKVKQAR